MSPRANPKNYTDDCLRTRKRRMVTAPDRVRVRQGIQFIEQDEANGELRVTGDDDAGMLLWAAQWLDEHREYIITAIRFEHSAEPGDEASITATVIISLTSPGYDPDPTHTRPRLGPWTHGVPPMPPMLPRSI